jgi:hypothetical protein
MLHNTLQLFITNRCDRRCRGCFYTSRLSSDDMSLDTYRRTLDAYVDRLAISKVVLLGGEPTLHRYVQDFVSEALLRRLLVTVYTNGARLEALSPSAILPAGLTVRIGVLGYLYGEKPLSAIKSPPYPVSIVYMLRKDNVGELDAAARDAEERFDCRYFMVSSIRDVAATGSYWKDTPETLSNVEYKEVVEAFLGRYRGGLDVHVANRGVYPGCGHDRCRFLNVYPDGGCTLCPFDISPGVVNDPKDFGRKCNKHSECLLQKWVARAGRANA